jgi:hypothetical protein
VAELGSTTTLAWLALGQTVKPDTRWSVFWRPFWSGYVGQTLQRATSNIRQRAPVPGVSWLKPL